MVSNKRALQTGAAIYRTDSDPVAVTAGRATPVGARMVKASPLPRFKKQHSLSGCRVSVRLMAP